MNLNVIWTPEATETFNNNLDYLEKEWSAEVCDQFTERVYKVISKISQNPKLYALTRTQIFSVRLSQSKFPCFIG